MARKNRNHAPEKENNERWLLTYSDLITLLMIFFVVLYSISKVDADKFRAVADSLNKALGGGTPSKLEINTTVAGPSIVFAGDPRNQQKKDQDKDKNKAGKGNADQENMTIMGIKAKLDKFALANGLQTKIVSSMEERGLVISIQETILFPSGSAVLTPYAHQILNKISVVLSTIPNYIRVEGHTDNLPINSPQYPSNWELSVLRATNVLHILATEGNINANHMSADGYAEFRPVAPNDTEANRARNRRVDLVILRTKYDLTEPGLQNK